MKVRTFLIGLFVTIILLIGISLGLWKASYLKSPLNANNDKITIPEAGKFFPHEPFLSLHINFSPNDFPKYIEASLPGRKRKEAKKKSIEFRDSIFALIGLDYEKDLSSWGGTKFSFAIFNPKDEDDNAQWLLVLEQGENPLDDNFLDDFWERRALRATTVTENIKDGISIKSGSKKQFGKYKDILSTAIINKNQILIASGERTLEESLDIFKNPKVSQFENQKIIEISSELDNGLALLSISKEGLKNWFGIPSSLSRNEDLENFSASLKINNSKVLVDGIFSFKNEVNSTKNQSKEALNLLQDIDNSFADFSILTDTKRLFLKDNQDPISQLIEPSLANVFNNSKLIAAKEILKEESGPLIFARNQSNWLIVTGENKQEALVDEYLGKANFSKMILSSELGDLTVWSRVKLEEKEEKDILRNELGAVLLQLDGLNLWSNDIIPIKNLNKNESFSTLKYSEEDIYKKNGVYLNQQIVLGRDSAKKVLKEWNPWILLETMTEDKLAKNIESLFIAIGNNQDEKDSEINLRAKITFD